MAQETTASFGDGPSQLKSTMAYKAVKTEHSGAKHGNGAYWGPKKDAKKESNKVRRRNGKRSVKQELLG